MHSSARFIYKIIPNPEIHYLDEAMVNSSFVGGVKCHTLLFKWQFQPGRQGRSWQITIRNQRRAISLHLKQAPSLKSKLNDAEWLEIIWGDAVYQASKETGLDNFPETCPWSIDDILTDGWIPTASN